MSYSFSLQDAVLTIDGTEISGFEGAQDAISITPIGDDGAITRGVNGDGVFVHTSNQGATIELKIIQHAEANKILMDLRNEQVKNPTGSVSHVISYKDLRNGDEVLMTSCWFTTPPTIARGNAHNGYTWKLEAVKTEFSITAGKL